MQVSEPTPAPDGVSLELGPGNTWRLTNNARRALVGLVGSAGAIAGTKLFVGPSGGTTSIEALAQRRIPRAGVIERIDLAWTLVLATETLQMITRLNGADLAGTTVNATGATSGRTSITGLNLPFAAGDLVCESGQLTAGVNSGNCRGVDLGVVYT